MGYALLEVRLFFISDHAHLLAVEARTNWYLFLNFTFRPCFFMSGRSRWRYEQGSAFFFSIRYFLIYFSGSSFFYQPFLIIVQLLAQEVRASLYLFWEHDTTVTFFFVVDDWGGREKKKKTQR